MSVTRQTIDESEIAARELPGAVDEEHKQGCIMGLLTSRRFWAFMIVVGVIVAAIGIPHLFWVFAPELQLKITMIDKTVPFTDRREHRGLSWLLIQNKFIDQHADYSERYYIFDEDYIGFHPLQPPLLYTSDWLGAGSLADRDVLIIADSYGVYTGDYYQYPGKQEAATRKSPKMFGGMMEEEVDEIESFCRSGKLIISEFNSFASPTHPALRSRMETILGISWTRWVGRYFLDFQDDKDVPEWLHELYMKQTGKDNWDVNGSGYVLCRDDSSEYVILRDGQDVTSRGLELVPRVKYIQGDVLQGVKPNRFNFWFDIVIPHERAEVLADFKLHLTPSGQQLIEAHPSLPPMMTIPAVVRVRSDYTSYYFSGDFVDFNKAMGPPNSRLTLFINRSYWNRPAPGGHGCFFWHTFYPMMSNILRLEAAKNTGKPTNPLLF